MWSRVLRMVIKFLPFIIEGVAIMFTRKKKKTEVEKKEPLYYKPPVKPHLIPLDFPTEQYFPVEAEKKQIVIHHSAGWDNARGMFEWWMSNPQRIATTVGITDDGSIYQGFDEAFWGHHLGVPNETFLAYGIEPIFETLRDGSKRMMNNILLNKHSIGIEICNWGKLEQRGRIITTYTGRALPQNKVMEYDVPFRGSRFYERYTEHEIEALRELILWWSYRYNIPLEYHEDMWDVSPRALNGEPGIWTHVSFRRDKSDAHPQPELIEMLQNLIY